MDAKLRGMLAQRPCFSTRSVDVSCNIAYRSRRTHACRSLRVYCKSTDPPEDLPPNTGPRNQLAVTIRRKQQAVGALLEELGMDTLEERLQSATTNPARPPHRFAQLIQDIGPTGRPVLVMEVSRSPAATSALEIGQLAARYSSWGADAISVRIDAADTPTGMADLFAAVQSAKVPVLARDWFIHPLQVAEAKEAGAAGVLGVIASVLGPGAPVMSSFAAAIGLDAPVEVVNASEVQQLESSQVPFFAINLSVGISLALPGFKSDMAKGLLLALPFGAISLVGVKTLKEARAARLAGADALLIDQNFEGGPLTEALVQELIYSVGGDD